MDKKQNGAKTKNKKYDSTRLMDRLDCKLRLIKIALVLKKPFFKYDCKVNIK